MANDCQNNVSFTHQDPEMILKIAKAIEDDTFLETIYPTGDFESRGTNLLEM